MKCTQSRKLQLASKKSSVSLDNSYKTKKCGFGNFTPSKVLETLRAKRMSSPAGGALINSRIFLFIWLSDYLQTSPYVSWNNPQPQGFYCGVV